LAVYDLKSFDLADLLCEIVRERSVYDVLVAFTEACSRRATLIARDLEKPDLDPALRAEYEKEMDFYEVAAENLRLAHAVIQTDARLRSTGVQLDALDGHRSG
jgi:hypothetical protein